MQVSISPSIRQMLVCSTSCVVLIYSSWSERAHRAGERGVWIFLGSQIVDSGARGGKWPQVSRRVQGCCWGCFSARVCAGVPFREEVRTWEQVRTGGSLSVHLCYLHVEAGVELSRVPSPSPSPHHACLHVCIPGFLYPDTVCSRVTEVRLSQLSGRDYICYHSFLLLTWKEFHSHLFVPQRDWDAGMLVNV